MFKELQSRETERRGEVDVLERAFQGGLGVATPWAEVTEEFGPLGTASGDGENGIVPTGEQAQGTI